MGFGSSSSLIIVSPTEINFAVRGVKQSETTDEDSLVTETKKDEKKDDKVEKKDEKSNTTEEKADNKDEKKGNWFKENILLVILLAGLLVVAFAGLFLILSKKDN